MSPRPRIFISAVTKELKSARQLVANTLQFLGYEPVWQDIFGTEQGDLRAMLRKQIDDCKGVVQIVGQCYGAEPGAPDEQSGRVSYTQYEALYARQRGKKVWYLILERDFPNDPHSPEPQEVLDLQTAYRQRVCADTHLYYELNNPDALKAKVHEIKDELSRLRRGARVWATSVAAILVLILALVIWLVVALKPQREPEPVTKGRAEAAFSAKNYVAAFNAYVQLSSAKPTNLNYHRRVEEAARLGLLRKPFLDHYLALVQQQPKNAIARNYLGNAFLMIDPKDRDGRARESYEAALCLDPQLAPPMANLGILNYRSGKADEAETLFKRYLSIEPGDAQGWVNLGLLYLAKMQANTNDAHAIISSETALRRALCIDQGSSSAYKALGRLLMATGRRREAVDAYERSLALNGDQSDVRQLLAGEVADERVFGTPSDDFTTRGLRDPNTNEVRKPSSGDSGAK